MYVNTERTTSMQVVSSSKSPEYVNDLCLSGYEVYVGFLSQNSTGHISSKFFEGYSISSGQLTLLLWHDFLDEGTSTDEHEAESLAHDSNGGSHEFILSCNRVEAIYD